VVVREIDDRGKVSLDLAEGVELVDSGTGGGESSSRPSGDGRDRDRSGGRRRDRNRGDRRGGDRGDEKAPEAKPGRTVVSFEDDFESGL
jgi:hypothetical protein